MGDPEIEAMSAVATALADLQTDAQGRVLRWAAERYSIVLGGQDGARGDVGGASRDQTDGDDAQKEADAEPPTFDHFAELFAAAGPKNKVEKLLVAAYWHQRIQGEASFQASQLNRDLKDLGHQVDHISQALAASIKKEPALVLQLRKSRNSRQARKTYKLSGVGLKVVEQTIRNNR
jgi:hypothetical protein